MLNQIWLTPPLAFARVGSSATPVAAFMWSHNDLAPAGTGQTTLKAHESIELDADGNPVLSLPDRIVFRDKQGIRPVCPYFELHGTWVAGGKEDTGPLTLAILQKLGISLRDITWDIHCAQLKAFHYTYEEGDRIDARLRTGADDTRRHVLEGRSPAAAKHPLVAKGNFVPFGAIQACKPNDAVPEIRLRFYAPQGLTYGPSNIDARIKGADLKIDDNTEWTELKMPKQRQILHPDSHWAKFVLERNPLGPFGKSDLRNTPESLFAFLLVGADRASAEHHSLGMVDDISDGIITCTVNTGRRKLAAIARIVVGPPDFGPASRPPISLADNLADREERGNLRKEAGLTTQELEEIVLDIFERAFETSDLINKDAQNRRCHYENGVTLGDLGGTSGWDADEVKQLLWADIADHIEAIRTGKASPHQLSEGGERKHRRYATLEYLKTRFRENPELFETWIRRPLDPNPYFDTRMPALMRGSDTRPWHLTRRQWEIMRLWVQRVGKPVATGTASLAANPKAGH